MGIQHIDSFREVLVENLLWYTENLSLPMASTQGPKHMQ